MIELAWINHEQLLQLVRIIVRRRPDPEVRDVAVIGHLVRWVTSAGNDHGVHIRVRPVGSADDVSRKVFQQLVRKRQDDAPVLRPRRSGVAVRRGQFPKDVVPAASQLEQALEVFVLFHRHIHIRPPHVIDDYGRRQRAYQRFHHFKGLGQKIEIRVPAQRLNLFGDAPDHVGGCRLARDVRQESKAHAPNAGGMETAELLRCHVLVDAGHTGRSSFHVRQRIDDNIVVGAVAGGLDHDETPEAHFADENLLLFLPGRGERLIFGLRRQREPIERPDHVHVGINRTSRHWKNEGSGVWILLYVWFSAHWGTIAQIEARKNVLDTQNELYRPSMTSMTAGISLIPGKTGALKTSATVLFCSYIPHPVIYIQPLSTILQMPSTKLLMEVVYSHRSLKNRKPRIGKGRA